MISVNGHTFALLKSISPNTDEGHEFVYRLVESFDMSESDNEDGYIKTCASPASLGTVLGKYVFELQRNSVSTHTSADYYAFAYAG